MFTTFANFSSSRLETYGGQIKSIRIFYMLSGSSAAGLSDDVTYPTEFTTLGQVNLGNTDGDATYEAHVDYSAGLNPKSERFRLSLPPNTIPHQSSSIFNQPSAKIKSRTKLVMGL